MLSCFLSEKESKIVILSEESNSDEMLSWKIPNVFFPLMIVFASLFIYGIFISNFVWIDFFNLLINGSILMAAFNRMSNIVSYFSKIEFNNPDAMKFGINIKNIRLKIAVYAIFLVLFISAAYCHQVIYKPFNDSIIILMQLIISLLFFWFAVDATKVAYLFQEAFLKNTFETSFKLEQILITETPTKNDIKF